MLSCKKSSLLIEKRLFSGLNLIEKIQLSVHVSMCDACKNYEKQSAELDKSLKNHVHNQQPTATETKLSEETKASILRNIDAQK